MNKVLVKILFYVLLLSVSTTSAGIKDEVKMMRSDWKIAGVVAKYIGLTFGTISARGIKASQCEFYDRNNKLVVTTDDLVLCFHQKIYHDLNYLHDGMIRMELSNFQGEKVWAKIKWSHAKLRTKTDKVGYKKVLQKLKPASWLKLYKGVLTHSIEFDLEAPLTFKLQGMSFSLLKDVRKVSVNLYVEKETEYLIGKLEITDDLGIITGQLKSDFKLSDAIKNELSNKRLLSKLFRHKEIKFITLIDRELNIDASLDQLPPVIIKGQD